MAAFSKSNGVRIMEDIKYMGSFTLHLIAFLGILEGMKYTHIVLVNNTKSMIGKVS